MKYSKFFAYAITAISGAFIVEATCSSCTKSSPRDLTKHLLDNYPEAYKYARPVNNASDTVNVKFGVALIRTKYIDRREGVFQVWFRYLWHDSHLTWDPEKFGGQTLAHLPTHKIWTPDIRLYNSLDDDISIGTTSVIVYSTGEVLWVPPATIRVETGRGDNLFYYYFFFKFGSWTYDGFKVDLAFYEGQNQFDTSDYVNSSYVIVHNKARRAEMYYPCCQEPYPSLNFSLQIAEKR